MYLVFLGAPGAGKGTQAATVARELELAHIERISEPDCEKGVIFDGFPRNLAQAEALDEALAKQAKAIDKVVYINVSEEELLKRLGGRWICRQCQAPYHATTSPPKVRGTCDKCGGELYQRPDDTEETIKERLQVYFNQTAPLIDYYEQAGKLLKVEGEGSIYGVQERIIGAINKELVHRREG